MAANQILEVANQIFTETLEASQFYATDSATKPRSILYQAQPYFHISFSILLHYLL